MTRDTWRRSWLPARPYAADDLRHGIRRTDRATALALRHVQANGTRQANTLITDIDHRDAELRALSCPATPTAVTSNRANGHAHAIWMLAEPVTTTEYAHRKPVAYACAVTEALRRATDGDIGYTGLIMKNPTHDHWDTVWFAAEPWTLDGLSVRLADWMPRKGWRKDRVPTGLGRNCSLFDDARNWAYRELRHHWGDSNGLRDAIRRRAHELNTVFPDPLPPSEADAIARSIHKWIVTKSRMWRDGQAAYEEKFKETQRIRGIRSGMKRAGMSLELTERIINP